MAQTVKSFVITRTKTEGRKESKGKERMTLFAFYAEKKPIHDFNVVMRFSDVIFHDCQIVLILQKVINFVLSVKFAFLWTF